MADTIENLRWKLRKRGFKQDDAYLHDCGACGQRSALRLGLQGRIGGRGNAKAGYVLGIVGTAMGALSLLLVLVFALGGAFSTSFHTCTSVDENGVYNTNC